jgi:hypothetical protein
MPSRWRWLLVVTGATALDLLARFARPFDFRQVMHVEAALFLVTAFALAILLRSERPMTGWPYGARVGLIWFFGLGSLRPLLWTLGLRLVIANLVTLAAGLAGVVVLVLRRWRRVPLPNSSQGAPPAQT